MDGEECVHKCYGLRQQLRLADVEGLQDLVEPINDPDAPVSADEWMVLHAWYDWERVLQLGPEHLLEEVFPIVVEECLILDRKKSIQWLHEPAGNRAASRLECINFERESIRHLGLDLWLGLRC